MLGGTFNPPHLGHLALARHARDELALDRVLLMPARLAPHKSAAEDPGAPARLQMCRLLVAADADGADADADGDGVDADGAATDAVDVCALELERTGPSYTVDTLRALHEARPRTSLTFILGADVARTLPAWREPRALLDFAELAVALRPGSAIEDVRAALVPLLRERAREDRVRFLTMAPLEVSSSLIRARARRGEPIAALTGPAVAAYVDAERLYRAPLREASPP